MNYSIRQIEAFIWLYDRRRNKDNARALQIAHYGAHAKGPEVAKKVKEWTK